MEPVNLGEKIGTTCYKILLSCPTLGRAGTRLDFFQADIRGSRGHMSHLLSVGTDGEMRSFQSPFCPFYKLHVYLYLLVWLLSSLTFRVIGCMKFGSLVMLSQLSWLSVSDSLMMFVRDRLGQKWRLCVSNLYWDKTIMLFPLHVWEETAIIFIFV